MNPTTHIIRASYAVNGTEWHEVETNGDNFNEIVADMLDFWNDADNLTDKFTISHTFNPDSRTTVTEIVGKVYGYRDGNLTTDTVDNITIHVTAVER